MDKKRARIFEVGPRDGLQNEAAILTVEQKLEMIRRLVAAGARDVEIGSFVHPKWVPQMADTAEVAAGLGAESLLNQGAANRSDPSDEGVRYWGLIPNSRGLDRALDAGVRHIAAAISSSEAHNQNNLNRSIDESLADLKSAFSRAKAEGCQVRAYISTVFGCPFEGSVDFDRVTQIGEKMLEYGADLISLGDTIGAGVPVQVGAGCERAVRAFGADRVALHLHDTQGLGLVNALVAWQAGMRQFDCSVGATGGCPYAPGAAGNLGSEDLIHLFDTMDIETGIDVDALLQTSAWLQENTSIRINSRYFLYRQTSTVE